MSVDCGCGWSSADRALSFVRWAQVIIAGFTGTVAITALMYFVAPMMGVRMDIAEMLGSLLGGSWWAGLALHFLHGTVIFPVVYAALLYRYLPGAPAVRGLTWGLALWLVAQVVVMPMMGAGIFSIHMGGVPAALGSLMGHCVYGFALGALSGPLTSK